MLQLALLQIRTRRLQGMLSSKQSFTLTHSHSCQHQAASSMPTVQQQPHKGAVCPNLAHPALCGRHRFFTIKYGDKIFFEYGTTGKKVEWNTNMELLKRWKEGTTGLPLVDANMRELARSGECKR